MINLIIQILSINKICLIEYKYLNVALTIKGTRNKNVYDMGWLKEFPDEVYIKGKKQNDITPNYNFEDTETTVNLLWYNNIKHVICIFFKCPDITELDFSYF